MRASGILALLLALGGLPADAQAPETSLRPQPRPTVAAMPEPADPAPAVAATPSPRPRQRPVEVASAEPAVTATSTLAVPHPRPRPAKFETAAIAPEPDAADAPVKPERKKKASRKGSVCGDREVKGTELAPIKSKVKGCGVADPVQVTSVDGIRLNPPATLNCETAIALKDWVKKGMRPAFGNREVVEFRVAAHYICRPRNNVRGNKISEHGRGAAIDIAGFVFSDGKEWTVLHDYNKQIRKAHKAACGIFGTTLGPGSDGYHENHLHFDTAHQRGGPYCR